MEPIPIGLLTNHPHRKPPMSVWTRTFDENRRERFWLTAPTDPMAQARKHGHAHFNRALGKVLMPQSHMPIGEHRDKIMAEVPADYLAWVQAQPWAQQWPDWAPVADYLARHPLTLENTAWPPTICFVSPPIACPPTETWKWDTYCQLTALRGHEDKLHAFAQGALRLRRDWAIHATAGEPLHYRLSLARRHMAIQLGAFALEPGLKAKTAHQQHLREAAQDEPTCTKHAYGDETEANGAINHAALRRHNPLMPKRKDEPILRAYECPKCGFWHLTKQALRQ